MSLEQNNVYPLRTLNAKQLALALDDSRAVAEELIELRHLEMAEEWLEIEERALEVEMSRLDVKERALNVERLQLEVDADGIRQRIEAGKVAHELSPKLKEARLRTELVEVNHQRYRRHLSLLGNFMAAVGTGFATAAAATGAYFHVPSTGFVAGGIGVATTGGAMRVSSWIQDQRAAKSAQDPLMPTDAD